MRNRPDVIQLIEKATGAAGGHHSALNLLAVLLGSHVGAELQDSALAEAPTLLEAFGKSCIKVFHQETLIVYLAKKLW